MAALVSGKEIVLTGTVGELFWSDCFTAGDVTLALAQVGRDQDVVIRLNSGGGIATEGAAIHAALTAHRGRKTVIVEGVAASAASVIAMAGDEIVMALGAVMMVHDPSGFTFGTVADHELQIRALTALATAMAGIYADRTGKTVDEARADMRTEVWMTPEEAVAQGYADRVQARAANDDEPGSTPEPTAFDYRRFQHPPERLVAMADRNGWARRAPAQADASAASPRSKKDTPMTTEKPTDPKGATASASPDLDAARREAAAAERTRVSAIVDSEEAKGREDLARHFAFATDMAPDVAKAALAKAPQATAAPPTPAEPRKEPNRFEAAMDKAGNPQVGADGGPAAEGGGGDADPTARILANYRAATGAKPKAA